jgi:hypothetical protein
MEPSSEPRTDLQPDPEAAQVSMPSVDQAYSSAGPRMFDGEILKPWTGRRRTAAFELGMKGDGSVLDPIRMLYSCVMKESDIFLSFRRPDQIVKQMLDWAEKHECLDPTMKRYEEAAKIAMEIANEVDVSSFKTEGDGTPSGN